MPVHQSRASASTDARNRAWRTFCQGLAVDVVLAAAVALALAVADPHFDWTLAYWAGVGLSLAKTLITTVTAYVARKLLPPPT